MQIVLSSGFINLDLEVICAQSLLVSMEIIWKICLVKKRNFREIKGGALGVTKNKYL